MSAVSQITRAIRVEIYLRFKNLEDASEADALEASSH